MTAAATTTPAPVDSRATLPGVCGLTHSTGSVEWVCIAKTHDSEKQRSARPSPLGYHPRSERHYFVRKYPARSVAR